MVGGRVAAVPTTPLVASEHNQYLWPDRPFRTRCAPGSLDVDVFFAHGPGARATVLEHGLPLERTARGSRRSCGTQDRASDRLPTPRIVFAGRLHADKGPTSCWRRSGACALRP